MIDPTAYLCALDSFSPVSFPKHLRGRGGQELLLPEIAGLFHDCPRITLPFSSGPGLALGVQLQRIGHSLTMPPGLDCYSKLPLGDGLYFGTPTIVNDRPLFAAHESWDKEKERAVVRSLCEQAALLGYKRIVSGLGSGDVTIEERIADMGCSVAGQSAEVACMKRFDGFTDWLLILNL